MSCSSLRIRGDLKVTYSDLYTSEVLSELSSMARFNSDIKEVMKLRIKRRKDRQQQGQRITFSDNGSFIPRTNIKVEDARAGKFEGTVIPSDLQRQWVQGTVPAVKPDAPLESSMDVSRV